MQRDTRIDLTIKMAFEKVLNVNNRTAKALVFYLDEMFKKEIKLTWIKRLMQQIRYRNIQYKLSSILLFLDYQFKIKRRVYVTIHTNQK